MKVSKLFLFSIALLVIVLVFSTQAHADLNLVGQGTSTYGTYNLIYDTDLDITWYDYSNYTSWPAQMDWADALSVTFGGNVYDDWRLPSTVDGSAVMSYDGTTTNGYNITNSEMGHLFYTELRNAGRYNTLGNPTGCGGSGQPSCLTNTGDFQNLQSSFYWSGTAYSLDTSFSWGFDTNSGNQTGPQAHQHHYALAVRSGLAVVPEPVSSTLFIVGGATLGFRRFLKRKPA